MLGSRPVKGKFTTLSLIKFVFIVFIKSFYFFKSNQNTNQDDDSDDEEDYDPDVESGNEGELDDDDDISGLVDESSFLNYKSEEVSNIIDEMPKTGSKKVL